MTEKYLLSWWTEEDLSKFVSTAEIYLHKLKNEQANEVRELEAGGVFRQELRETLIIHMHTHTNTHAHEVDECKTKRSSFLPERRRNER